MVWATRLRPYTRITRTIWQSESNIWRCHGGSNHHTSSIIIIIITPMDHRMVVSRGCERNDVKMTFGWGHCMFSGKRESNCCGTLVYHASLSAMHTANYYVCILCMSSPSSSMQTSHWEWCGLRHTDVSYFPCSCPLSSAPLRFII